MIMNDYKWYQGDLHTHTVHSDGLHTIREAVKIAKDENLSFIALTDHNTVSQNMEEVDIDEFALIYGVELTTKQGHVNFLGLKKPVENFRFETEEDVVAMTKEAFEAGAYISINHPFVGDRWRWAFEPMTFHGIELWNGKLLSRNKEVIKWWQEQLTQGEKIYITGGSDVHKQGMKDRWYGKGRSIIYAKALSNHALVEALKKGHNGVGASGNVSLCQIFVNGYMMGDTVEVKEDKLSLKVLAKIETDVRLKVYNSNGLVVEKNYQAEINECFDVDVSSLFYRAELWQLDENGQEVNPFFTNPIYFNI